MVEVIEYRPEWPSEFEEAARVIAAAMGPLALRVDHIGSTAVPGLCAKDVIDVQITVAALDEPVVRAMTAAGFVHRLAVVRDHVPPGGDSSPGLWRKFFFVEPDGYRRLNVHVRRAGLPNQRFPLLFRDFLIAAPHYAAANGTLKRRLAEALTDPVTYADVKDPAVDLIYFAALEWANRTSA